MAGAVRLLVNCFIPLKSSDLEKWQEDPEEWATAEEKDNDAWEFDVRVSFMCTAYLDILIKLVISLVVKGLS